MKLVQVLPSGRYGAPHNHPGWEDSHRDVCQHVPATAYLGGPMRGIPYWNFPTFDKAAEALRAKGWTIHSPAEHDRELGLVPVEDGTVTFPVSACLDWDFQKIAESSCVIVLPGWETSTGCHWEFTVAYALNKPVFQYPELTPVELPEVVTNPVRAAYPDIAVVNGQPMLARDYAHVRGVDGPGAYAITPERIWTGPISVNATSSDTRVVDPVTGGEKGSKGIPWHLLPWNVLRELAKHYQRGCKKYAPRNWERGYAWSLSYDSLCNHLAAFWARDDIDQDPEVGPFPHIVAVVWHACALAYFWLTGKGTDDRPDA